MGIITAILHDKSSVVSVLQTSKDLTGTSFVFTISDIPFSDNKTETMKNIGEILSYHLSTDDNNVINMLSIDGFNLDFWFKVLNAIYKHNRTLKFYPASITNISECLSRIPLMKEVGSDTILVGKIGYNTFNLLSTLLKPLNIQLISPVNFKSDNDVDKLFTEFCEEYIIEDDGTIFPVTMFDESIIDDLDKETSDIITDILQVEIDDILNNTLISFNKEG